MRRVSQTAATVAAAKIAKGTHSIAPSVSPAMSTSSREGRKRHHEPQVEGLHEHGRLPRQITVLDASRQGRRDPPEPHHHEEAAHHEAEPRHPPQREAVREAIRQLTERDRGGDPHDSRETRRVDPDERKEQRAERPCGGVHQILIEEVREQTESEQSAPERTARDPRHDEQHRRHGDEERE
jgi:hypothetical protein